MLNTVFPPVGGESSPPIERNGAATARAPISSAQSMTLMVSSHAWCTRPHVWAEVIRSLDR
jgi:hypothetical protein